MRRNCLYLLNRNPNKITKLSRRRANSLVSCLGHHALEVRVAGLDYLVRQLVSVSTTLRQGVAARARM